MERLAVESAGEDLKIYREKDTGIYDAMNRAVAHASGRYFFFLNCGDYFEDETVLARVKSEIARAGERNQDVLYRNKRNYRKNVRYVVKHLELYDYVVGSEELTKLSCAAFENGKVERIITSAKNLEIDKILDGIRGE